MPARDFSAVYDEHVWRVYGFFAYRMRSRADAEDLTQQTFERALRAWSRYDPSKAGVATWLLVIARNLLVDHHRADRSSRQQPLDEFGGDGDALVDHATATPDLGLAPDLERALASLGGARARDHRAALWRRAERPGDRRGHGADARQCAADPFALAAAHESGHGWAGAIGLTSGEPVLARMSIRFGP